MCFIDFPCRNPIFRGVFVNLRDRNHRDTLHNLKYKPFNNNRLTGCLSAYNFNSNPEQKRRHTNKQTVIVPNTVDLCAKETQRLFSGCPRYPCLDTLKIFYKKWKTKNLLNIQVWHICIAKSTQNSRKKM